MANEGQTMNLSCLLSLLREIPAYRKLAGELSTAKDERKAVILDAAKPYLIAALYEELGLPVMLVTARVPPQPSCIVSLSLTSCPMTGLSYRLLAIRWWRG